MTTKPTKQAIRAELLATILLRNQMNTQVLALWHQLAERVDDPAARHSLRAKIAEQQARMAAEHATMAPLLTAMDEEPNRGKETLE